MVDSSSQTDLQSVDLALSGAMIAEGWIRVTPREAELLNLSVFSGRVKIESLGDSFDVSWHAGSGRLGGEDLADHLQMHAQVGWTARLLSKAHSVSLQILDRAVADSDVALRSDAGGLAPSAPSTKFRRQRRAGHTHRLRDRSEYDWKDQAGLRTESLDALIRGIRTGGWDDPDFASLRVEGERLASLDQFDELLAVEVARIDQMPHQEAAARKVLSKMSGRGVLADEVGLGKTIEGGLVMKELILRGLAERVLIFCPASLRLQWKEELKEKFGEDFVIVERGSQFDQTLPDRLIMTSQLGRQNIERLIETPFDTVLVDEVHKAKGPKTAAAIQQLTEHARFVLFLTATPVENSLLELYQLVEMLRPGTFASERSFRETYMERDDERRPKNPEGLRRLVSDVIVRTTRAQAGLDRVQRRTVDIAIELERDERELYELCLYGLRTVLDGAHDVNRRRNLARKITTSPSSLATSARKMASSHENPAAVAMLNEVADLAAGIEVGTRERTALRLAKEWIAEHGQVIVFSQHPATVESLSSLFEASGLSVSTFIGAMSNEARASAISEFKSGRSKVLLSSDAGAEGLNLQSCNCIINFDLPWNPMKIEQRIGRVDRVGQPRDEVFVANMFAAGTVDEAVYQLLHDKLAMFELLFGQVTTILGELDDSDGSSFEARVFNALVEPESELMEQRLGRFGDQLEQARRSADVAITYDTSISNWLVDRESVPAQANRDGELAGELLPQVRTAAATRQEDLREWVLGVLDATGSHIAYRTDDFVSVELSPDLADSLGSKHLNLAFHREGLEVHPEAELCVVASEIFDLLVEAVRDRGDLVARRAHLPKASEIPDLELDDSLRLGHRAVEIAGLRGEATVRVRLEGGGEQIHSVDINGGLPDPDFFDGCELLPPGFLLSKRMIKKVESSTRSSVKKFLGPIAKSATTSKRQEVEASQARWAKNLEQRLVEMKGDPKAAAERKGLQRKIKALKSEIMNPDVEVRCDVLQLRLYVGEESLVVDHVERRGQSIPVSRRISDGEVMSLVGNDHLPIEVLAVCSAPHLTDVARVTRCGRCDRSSCTVCSNKLDPSPCALCGTAVCDECETDGVCTHCASLDSVLGTDDHQLAEKCNLVGAAIRHFKRDRGDVLFVKSAGRREIIQLDKKGKLRSWRSLTRPDFESMVHQIQRSLGLPVVATVVSEDRPEPPDGSVLEKNDFVEVSCTIKSGDDELGVFHYSAETDDRDEIEARLLSELGTASASADLPMSLSKREAKRWGSLFEQFDDWEEPDQASLLVELRAGHESIAIFNGFLEEHVFSGGVASVRRARFEEVGSQHDFVAGFDPQPLLTHVAKISEFEVAVFSHGRNRWASFTARSEPVRWIRLLGLPEEPNRLASGIHLGFEAPLDVYAYVSESELSFIEIIGAALVRRSVQLAIGAASETGVTPVDGAEVSALLNIDFAKEPAADGFDLDKADVDDLLALPRRVEVVPADVGYVVSERWSDATGEFGVNYLVSPGESAGGIGVVDRDVLVPQARRCSEGHFAIHTATCWMCEMSACVVCVGFVVPCRCCGLPVCGDDLGQGGVCVMCAEVEPVRRRSRKVKDLRVGVGGKVQYAERLGCATARVTTGGESNWFRRLDGGEWESVPPADPGLDSRMSTRCAPASQPSRPGPIAEVVIP